MRWWRWWWCVSLVVSVLAAGAGGCAALCHCQREHLSCSLVGFHRFPHIEAGVRHVSVSQARLGALEEAALDGRALTTLVVVASRLHHIERHALASMALTLASLDLGHNEFTEIPIAALRNLKVLNWMNLQNNYITEVRSDTDWGSLGESLRFLSLSNNHISVLEAGSMSSLKYLVQLDVEGNRVFAVEGGALPRSLVALRLSDNLLARAPCGALARLPRLRTLHLRANNMRTLLNATCPLDAISIDSLDLSQNELDDRFMFPLQHRIVIKQVVLDMNEFTSVPSFVADGGGRLEKLSISYNRVRHVSEAMLHAVKHHLARLELAHNELREVPAGLRQLLRLRHLSLAFNHIEEVRHLPPHLHTLSLEGNYLSTFPDGLMNMSPGSLVYLDLGYNRISEMSCNNFGAWSESLLTLNLKGNRISQLSSDAFPAALPLRELILSFNDIYRVESVAFHNLTTLRILELSTTLLSGEFPNAAPPLDLVTWLSLDNNNIHYVELNHFDNFPSLEYLNLDFNKLFEFPTGTLSDNDYIALNETYRVKELRLSYNHIKRLNEKFMSRLTELQSVDMSYNRLTKVNKQSFMNLKNLMYVSMKGNIIVDIEPSAFSHLPRLEALELQHNHITEFSMGCLELVSNGENILTVNVSYNHITNLIGGGYSSYVNILDLTHNNLLTIHRNSFEPSGGHLQQLMLSNNKLKMLDYTSFGSLPRLQTLHLNNNHIKTVKRRTFTELVRLEILDLSHNHIQQLVVEQFHSVHALRHLRLNGNELRSVPRDCFKNTILEHLDLSDNKFNIFPSSALAQVGFTLRRLQLARNQLEYLDAAMFQAMPFLHELSLDTNALTVLSDNTFSALARLHSLHLSGNAIKTNFKMLFHNIPRLRQLSLARVGLRVMPHLPLLNLTDLDLNSNLIASYRQADVRWLPDLRSLDLSRNKFTSLQPAMWAALPRLTSLDVSSNPIVRVTRGSFEGLDRLLHLRMDQLRFLEAVEPRTFLPLRALRSLTLDSPVARGAAWSGCTVGDVAASTPALESLSVVMHESSLDAQLQGLRAVRLRALEVSGSALRRVSERAFSSLGAQRALVVRVRGTGVAALPAGLTRPLARVPHLALDFSDNQLVTFAPATLYPNLTEWNRLGTKLVSGGLVLSGNPLRCGCAVRWVGAWLRRWVGEAGAGGARARAAARASRCRRGEARVALVSLAPDAAECHASALSSAAPPRSRRTPALLWVALLYYITSVSGQSCVYTLLQHRVTANVASLV